MKEVITIITIIAVAGLCVFTVLHALDRDRDSVAAHLLTVEKVKYQRVPGMCRHLYNVGRHEEWAACMGVPYRRRQ